MHSSLGKKPISKKKKNTSFKQHAFLVDPLGVFFDMFSQFPKFMFFFTSKRRHKTKKKGPFWGPIPHSPVLFCSEVVSGPRCGKRMWSSESPRQRTSVRHDSCRSRFPVTRNLNEVTLEQTMPDVIPHHTTRLHRDDPGLHVPSVAPSRRKDVFGQRGKLRNRTQTRTQPPADHTQQPRHPNSSNAQLPEYPMRPEPKRLPLSTGAPRERQRTTRGRPSQMFPFGMTQLNMLRGHCDSSPIKTGDPTAATCVAYQES